MKLLRLNPRHWSLSKKITSIVLAILMVPVFSISLLQEIEKTLVDSVKDNLALSNRLIANQLVTNISWFEQSVLPDSNAFFGEEFFVFPISSSSSSFPFLRAVFSSASLSLCFSSSMHSCCKLSYSFVVSLSFFSVFLREALLSSSSLDSISSLSFSRAFSFLLRRFALTYCYYLL